MNKILVAGLSALVSIAPFPTPQTVRAVTKVAATDVAEPPSIRIDIGKALQPEPPSGLLSIVVGKSNQQIEDEAAAAKLAEAKKAISRRKIVHTVSPDVSDTQAIAYPLVVEAFGESEWSYFDTVVNMESGWRTDALNGSSGACGIPQALPCSKLPQGINTPAVDQIKWMIDYIKNRYGTPSSAVAFHNRTGWY